MRRPAQSFHSGHSLGLDSSYDLHNNMCVIFVHLQLQSYVTALHSLFQILPSIRLYVCLSTCVSKCQLYWFLSWLLSSYSQFCYIIIFFIIIDKHLLSKLLLEHHIWHNITIYGVEIEFQVIEIKSEREQFST